MGCMFCECCALMELDVSGFDFPAVTDVYGMLAGCESLVDLDCDNEDVVRTLR